MFLWSGVAVGGIVYSRRAGRQICEERKAGVALAGEAFRFFVLLMPGVVIESIKVGRFIKDAKCDDGKCEGL